jgi:hypothetical protein
MWVAVVVTVAIATALILTAGRVSGSVEGGPTGHGTASSVVEADAAPSEVNNGVRAAGSIPQHLTEAKDR